MNDSAEVQFRRPEKRTRGRGRKNRSPGGEAKTPDFQRQRQPAAVNVRNHDKPALILEAACVPHESHCVRFDLANGIEEMDAVTFHSRHRRPARSEHKIEY
jgi:hypothetical protein